MKFTLLCCSPRLMAGFSPRDLAGRTRSLGEGECPCGRPGSRSMMTSVRKLQDLTGLTEARRREAMERFAILRPHPSRSTNSPRSPRRLWRPPGSLSSSDRDRVTAVSGPESMTDLDIERNLTTYLGDRKPTSRYTSFDYCFNYFQFHREEHRLEELLQGEGTPLVSAPVRSRTKARFGGYMPKSVLSITILKRASPGGRFRYSGRRG